MLFRLGFNALTHREFPIHLSGLTKISRLNFTRNKISVIPANSLGTLLTLKELEFTGIYLKHTTWTDDSLREPCGRDT